MDPTFLQLVSLIIQLSNQLAEAQSKITEMEKALDQDGAHQ